VTHIINKTNIQAVYFDKTMRGRKVEDVYDEIAEDYSSDPLDSTTDGTARTALSFADDITWHFIMKYIPKDTSIKILDAGGGDGFWSQKIHELGYRNIVILDISAGMLKQAKKRFSSIEDHNISFVKADVADMNGIPSTEFDFVFSQYDAVSYSMKPRESVRELARVAKPGSYVVLTMDTKFRRVPELIEAGKIDEAENLLRTNVSYDFKFSQYNLTWQELNKYFEESGLAVIDIIGAPVFMHQVNEKIMESLEKNPDTRKRLLKMELEYCTDKSLVNFAGHIQIIGKKKN